MYILEKLRVLSAPSLASELFRKLFQERTMRFSNSVPKLSFILLCFFSTAVLAQVLQNDQVSKDFLKSARHQSGKVPPNNHSSQGSPMMEFQTLTPW
jgi:hypothetical protein